jgi:hypothetical protein
MKLKACLSGDFCESVKRYNCLTSDDHHANGEHFFVVGVRRHITESNRSHAGHREVQSGHVHGGSRGTANQFRLETLLIDRRKVERLLTIIEIRSNRRIWIVIELHFQLTPGIEKKK